MSACAASASYLVRYQLLARELDINIVPGTLCEVQPVRALTPPSDQDNDTDGVTKGNRSGKKAVQMLLSNGQPVTLANMTYWIAASTGEISGSYQKKNLWHPERPHLTPGPAHAPHRAFDTPLTKTNADGTTSPLRAGLLICWDLAFPEAFRALIADGADLIVVPAWWMMRDVDPTAQAINPLSEKLFLESVTMARAFENTCAVALCNAGGVSQVAVPVQGVLPNILGTTSAEKAGPAGIETEEMQIVELDTEVLRVAESNYKVRQDLGGPGWHYGYTLHRNREALSQAEKVEAMVGRSRRRRRERSCEGY